MLDAELRGQPYVKSHHSAALMAQIGRSHRSVEFKHQNISAVLDELGLPWIPGYKPKSNYQNAIFGGIDRYLSGHSTILKLTPDPPRIESDELREVFAAAPKRRTDEATPKGLKRLIRKFDPVERDHRNRALGKAGESFVLEVEQQRLTALNRRDLAREVRWVADQDGDGAGFDVLSFTPEGSELMIEVKTTNGGARTPFFLSRNEYEVAEANPLSWQIYRVHCFAQEARIFTVSPPLLDAMRLSPQTWQASF